MSKSSLATEVYLADGGNYTVGRSGRKIEAVAIHHMAGKLTAKQCGAIFQTVGRYGSSHYGIGYNGEIANYVDEDNTAWTNSNWDSNCKSVTIEVSNNINKSPWTVSDASLNSLIKLVADIAKRNNLGTLVKGKNVVWHSMFTSTTCPGEYLLSKMDYIIAEANKINSPKPEPVPINPTKYKVGDVVEVNGVYVSSDSTNKLNPGYTKGTITKVIEGANNPYLIDNGNLGWVNDGCIVENKPTPVEPDFKVGDIVVPTVLVDSKGTHLIQYDTKYEISQIDSRGALLRAVRGTERPIWAVLPLSNIRKVG